ncbi:hypothetical protein BDM02DRAFT_3219951 [Thelephora ganbajun]|uniref:Uncharacterized protein n=1 Tax=Thelephora ganbajun TaxID=370292 RepID=A0ACB6Z245_THEGA|nr:hypothetical protein BDM02DRAFT_3219951 [Thelephora ganbajun]
MLSQSGHRIPQVDVSIYPLVTTIQKDPISCGLFALNAISHYYLQQNCPLLQPDILSLAHYQMEIGLELLQEGTTAGNDTSFPFTLSNISPCIFIQPLPDILPIPPVYQRGVDPLPHISLHYFQMEGPTIHNTSPSDHAKDFPNSPISTPSLLTKNLFNKTSSALASDSDLPPSTKATKQAGLLDFFSKVPSEEFHAKWRKRKRDNEERDREEYKKRMQRGVDERLHKKAHKREQNWLAQERRWRKVKEKAKAESKNEIGQDSSEASIPDSHIPAWSEVAASSHPRQLIVSELKKREKEKTGQPYKPSKRNTVESQNINWKSPTFWPMIDQAVREQIGKPNLSGIIHTLQSRDNQFKYLTHQRLSDW